MRLSTTFQDNAKAVTENNHSVRNSLIILFDKAAKTWTCWSEVSVLGVKPLTSDVTDWIIQKKSHEFPNCLAFTQKSGVCLCFCASEWSVLFSSADLCSCMLSYSSDIYLYVNNKTVQGFLHFMSDTSMNFSKMSVIHKENDKSLPTTQVISSLALYAESFLSLVFFGCFHVPVWRLICCACLGISGIKTSLYISVYVRLPLLVYICCTKWNIFSCFHGITVVRRLYMMFDCLTCYFSYYWGSVSMQWALY